MGFGLGHIYGELEDLAHLIYAAASTFTSVAIGSTFNAQGAAMVTVAYAGRLVQVVTGMTSKFVTQAKSIINSLRGENG